MRGFLSIDVDVSELYINQCDVNNNYEIDFYYATNYQDKKFMMNIGVEQEELQPHHHHLQQERKFYTQLLMQQQQNQLDNQIQIDVFHGSHKCHRDSMQVCAASSKLLIEIQLCSIDLFFLV